MSKKIKKRQLNTGRKITANQFSSGGSTNDKHPIFSLNKIVKDYCISNCTKDEKAAFVDTLHRLSQLTWQDLTNTQRHGLGYEKIDRSSISNIPGHITADVTLIAFRFFALAPMVGYRDQQIFNIVWVDKNFNLYAHE